MFVLIFKCTYKIAFDYIEFLVNSFQSMYLFNNLFIFFHLSEVTEASGNGKQVTSDNLYPDEDIQDERPNLEEGSDSDSDPPAAEQPEVDYTNLSGRQKKWMELRNKMVNC